MHGNLKLLLSRRQPLLHHHFRHQQPPFISFRLFPPPSLFPVAHHSNTHTYARPLLFLLGCHHHRSMHTHQHFTHTYTTPSPWLFHDHLVGKPHPVSNFLSRHPKPETPPSLSTVETRKKRKEWVFRPLSSSDQPHSLSLSATRNSPTFSTSGLTEKHHKHPCFSVLVYLIHAHVDRKTHTSGIYTLWYPPISPVVCPYLTLSLENPNTTVAMVFSSSSSPFNHYLAFVDHHHLCHRSDQHHRCHLLELCTGTTTILP